MNKREIFDVWKMGTPSKRNKAVEQRILEYYRIEAPTERQLRVLQMFVSALCNKISNKYKKCQRKSERFLVENSVWLNDNITLPEELLQNHQPTISQVGRPNKSFDQCNLKVQKRKIKDLLASKTPKELTLAAELSLRASGNRDAASIVRDVSLTPSIATTFFKKAKKLYAKPEPTLSPNSALALIVDAKLSVHQYNTMKQQAKNVNSNLYPSYKKVQEAKKKMLST